MSELTALGWLIGPSIGVLGTLLGAVFGAWLTGRLHRRQWQREWMTGRIGDTLRYDAEVCRAIDQISVVHGQCSDAVVGTRGPVPHERVAAADAAWRDVLSTSRVYAHEDLQKALSKFDDAREKDALATNSRDADAMALAHQHLNAARLAVLDEIARGRNWINEALAGHLTPTRVRWRRRMRARPAYPVAPLPSERESTRQPSSG
ncbi:hypothetical protein E9529_15785 [Blastococcus sp. KM273128]|uniref:hypothetical protein n=1 Tax=Blastococcus sp. KM273128 TaxID=2570314 RepID=UPI001F240C65|nr:hypothetical protein [Blastococcus sp. KM273128]MCF6745707.1 hypothetical protein [Blastococcus sp. KM273128]